MPRPMSPARRVAQSDGRRFYLGPSCAHGHGQEAGETQRYTSTNACRACVAGQARPDRAKPAAELQEMFA